MEELVNSIFDFIVDNGLLTAVTGTLTPIVLKVLISKSFRNFVIVGLQNLVKALFKNTVLTHRLFHNIVRYKNMIKRISFTDTKKTKLFHILLDTKLTVANDEIVKWIDNNEKLLTSNKKLELRNSLEILTLSIVTGYETLIPENYFKYLENREEANYYFQLSYKGICKEDCEDYKKTNKRCEPACINSIGFEEYHRVNVRIVDRVVETVPECEGESNLQIFNYYLNAIDNALYSAIHDAKEVFNIQNGRYKRKYIVQ